MHAKRARMHTGAYVHLTQGDEAHCPELLSLLRRPSGGHSPLHVSLGVDEVMMARLPPGVLLPRLSLQGQAGLVQNQVASLRVHNHLGGPW